MSWNTNLTITTARPIETWRSARVTGCRVAAMKGMTWESPPGMITVDPETRDLIQDIYIRRVERVDGELYNVGFDRYQAVDPGKTARAK